MKKRLTLMISDFEFFERLHRQRIPFLIRCHTPHIHRAKKISFWDDKEHPRCLTGKRMLDIRKRSHKGEAYQGDRDFFVTTMKLEILMREWGEMPVPILIRETDEEMARLCV